MTVRRTATASGKLSGKRVLTPDQFARIPAVKYAVNRYERLIGLNRGSGDVKAFAQQILGAMDALGTLPPLRVAALAGSAVDSAGMPVLAPEQAGDLGRFAERLHQQWLPVRESLERASTATFPPGSPGLLAPWELRRLVATLANIWEEHGGRATITRDNPRVFKQQGARLSGAFLAATTAALDMLPARIRPDANAIDAALRARRSSQVPKRRKSR